MGNDSKLEEREHLEGVLFALLDHRWRTLKEIGQHLGMDSRRLIGPARGLKRAGRIESEFQEDRSNLIWRRSR